MRRIIIGVAAAVSALTGCATTTTSTPTEEAAVSPSTSATSEVTEETQDTTTYITPKAAWNALSSKQQKELCLFSNTKTAFVQSVEGYPNIQVNDNGAAYSYVSKKCAPIKKAERERIAAKKRAEREAYLASFTEVDSRTLAKIMRRPKANMDKNLIIYGEIWQFDSRTGTDAFLAEVASSNTTSYGFFDGDDALLIGTKRKFNDFIEEDVFRAKVVPVKMYNYDTAPGGTNSVPVFRVESIQRIGNNG